MNQLASLVFSSLALLAVACGASEGVTSSNSADAITAPASSSSSSGAASSAKTADDIAKTISMGTFKGVDASGAAIEVRFSDVAPADVSCSWGTRTYAATNFAAGAKGSYGVQIVAGSVVVSFFDGALPPLSGAGVTKYDASYDDAAGPKYVLTPRDGGPVLALELVPIGGGLIGH